MAEQNWSLRGEYMESCNCDYLCPCIYTNPQGPVTHDHCTALMAFRIDEGKSGATRLDGLKFAFVIRGQFRRSLSCCRSRATQAISKGWAV